MGAILNLFDKLSNVMSGMGTSVDRRAQAFYVLNPVTPQQAEAAYRSSWLMRKIIDIPPLDMTRAWRSWQAGKDKIEALEAEERRLQVKAKVKRALILARLWGGGGIVIGNGDADTMQPLHPGKSKGSLRYLNVYSRYQLTAGPETTDPESDWCGMPEKFTLHAGGKQIDLHPSRVVAFIGQKLPEGSLTTTADWFWGDPLLQSIDQALKNADLAQDGFASLIDEAKVDIIKIPELMSQVGSQEYENRLLARLGAAATGKSTWRALMLDGAEEWEQRQINWSGMTDILNSYLQIVAGAADIPVTRLLGQSPKGLQSNGDGEERDYHAMIAARQDEVLCPALDRIDELLIPSALGSRPSDIYYEMNSLERLSPKDAAEIEAKRASTVKTYADTGLFPEDALAKMAQNAVIESGQWPGSEAAFEEAKLDAPYEQEPDPNDLLTPEEQAAKGGDPASGGAGGGTKAPARTSSNDAWFFADAQAKPLYVQRKLLNAAELIAWAKAQGFATTLPADDMHVTVLYSRAAVDPMKMGEGWSSDPDGGLVVKAGGPRAIERLGENAVVLLFASWSLVSRHNEMVAAGASHDWDEYQPHVTLTYEVPDGIDLDTIKPFAGELRFGPEIFEPLDLDWKAKVVEDGGAPTGDRPFEDGRRSKRRGLRSGRAWTESDHPRGPGGKFRSAGGASKRSQSRAIRAHVDQVYRSPGTHRVIDLGDASIPALPGYRRTIDNGAVNHVRRSHGDYATERERDPPQTAVIKRDFQAIPRIVSTAGAPMVSGSLKGAKGQRLVYTATIGRYTYELVEIVQPRKKTVALKTLRKWE